jgi:hypothetical protein
MSKLKIGDTVLWRGGFGADPFRKVTVEEIEITNGGKYGNQVDSVEWSKVQDRYLVVTLDNGHWAYAYQIKRYPNG